ncbi:epithelial sodium channel subunit beta-like, partial [Saccoglossus kowalevskii]
MYTYEPHWSIEIGMNVLIYEVIITNNGDYMYASLAGAEIRAGGNINIMDNELCADRLTATQTSAVTFTVVCNTPLYGQFLGIVVKEMTQFLILCEVEIMAVVNKASNVAYGKHAEQSSQYRDGSAIKAVDGDKSSDYSHHSCMHTQLEYEPWWRVDIGYQCEIQDIVITNRQDCCSDRLIGAEVRVGNSKSLNGSNILCGTVTRDNIDEVVISCEDVVGRYVSIQIKNRTDQLHLCEVKVLGKDWRLAGAVVRVGYYEDPKQNLRCGEQVVPQITNWKKIPRTCSVPILGRYVSVQLEGVDSEVLQLCEVQVLGKELLIDPVEKIKQRALFALFDKRQYRRLISDDGEVYTDVSLETCLNKCYFRKAFVCKSFDYNDVTHVCTIYSVAADNMNTDLIVDANVNYYQRLLQGETEELGHKRLSLWLDIFKDITLDQSVYHRFLENIYQDSRFHRVKGENPPDWTRFKTFSNIPDHSDLRHVLKPTGEEVSRYGHQKNNFILQCTFASEQCGPSDFTQFQDDFYGNCFQFNIESDEQIKWVMGTGPQYGLQLTLFTEQEEYLSIYGQDSGARVSILPRDILSFPVDEGITVKPGTITSIAIKEKNTARKAWPYGNCTHGHTEQIVHDKQRNTSYSVLSCEKACSENALIRYCGCAEYIFTEAPRCQLLNKTQELCRQLTKYLNNIGKIKCSCPSPCKETNYDITSSQSQWPSDVYLDKLLKTLKWKHSKLKNVNDMQSARSNLVRLEIYFETLNYESVSEQAAYKWEDLLSDIGGTLGLYVGISIISVFEFVNFILLLCRRCPKNGNKVDQWVRRRKSRVGEQP